eukprot:m.336745 g.336745  ORF g.336745 m.336745 type:complete len:281 (+) comp17949_c0_seq1:76-918(+)
MARNEEKAQSMLARFRAAKKIDLEGDPEKRPWNAGLVDSVKECERWRQQITREIAKMVSKIQNAGLGEFRIRDLNDEINRKMRLKRHWEYRIRELGGPDYVRFGPKMLDYEGREVPGNAGYRYFGAARDLPGVRELLQVDEHFVPKSRGELFLNIDADYYGYRDEEDGILLPLEKEAEEIAVAKAEAEWREKQGSKLDEDELEDQYAEGRAADAQELAEGKMEDDREERGVIDVIPEEIPSQEEIEKLLLQRHKQLLLEKYASSELQAATENTKELTHRK